MVVMGEPKMCEDMVNYQEYLKHLEEKKENTCIRCGACCGAYEDPCLHLKQDRAGHYWCEIYTDRFGEHTTRGGETFECVPIREILHTRWPGSHLCAYKKSAFPVPNI